MTKEDLMALVSKRYDTLQVLDRHDNFYDYEKEFEKIWLELAARHSNKTLAHCPKSGAKKESRPDSAP